MKQNVPPAFVAVAIVLTLAVIVACASKMGSRSDNGAVDTGLPPEIAKRLQAEGPNHPMPPMPGKRTWNAPGATQNGPPAGRTAGQKL